MIRQFLTRLSLALLLGLVVGGSGCARPAPNERAAPESAFRAFRDALSAGNGVVVWSFLGEETRSQLEERLAELPESAGYTEPWQLVMANWVPTEEDIDRIERIEESDGAVTLEIHEHLGAVTTMVLLREGDGWVVELDLP